MTSNKQTMSREREIQSFSGYLGVALIVVHRRANVWDLTVPLNDKKNDLIGFDSISIWFDFGMGR
jgi:hypothetical protein